ncbi:MAG: Gfo/Idh/MocA family oxidoreductase [Hyphomonadaceae bacterium]|nr:Gfo/Idh/MocA family oxidoreductase [Hyphomonadaceae bacterium]
MSHFEVTPSALRIGLLGASRIASSAVLAPSRNIDGVEVVAVAARDPARAEAFALEHSIPSVAGAYDELVQRDDLDIIYNALPVALHEHWTLRALQAGKHVLLEKPAAPTAAGARALTSEAQRCDRRVIEAFHYRYHPLFARVLELAGGLGELVSAKAVLDVPVPMRPGEIRWDPAMGGGALMDLGCYAVHWLRTIGQEFTVETAQMKWAPCNVDESASAEVRFANGARGSLECAMFPHDRGRTATLQIRLSNGEIFVRNPILPQHGHELRWRAGGEWIAETAASTSSYQCQLEAVAYSLRANTVLPTEGEDIVNNAAALEAIAQSAGRGRT